MGKDAINIEFPVSVPAHTRKLLLVELNTSNTGMEPPKNGTKEENDKFSEAVLKRFVAEYPNVAAIQLRDTSQRVILTLPVKPTTAE
jgi:hypothetical protein